MKEREDEGSEGLVEESLRRREGVDDDGGGVRGGDFDLVVEVDGGEGGVEGLDRREEEGCGGGHGGEDLVADGDGGDDGGGMESDDVSADPGGGGSGGGSDCEKLVVWDADDDPNLGLGQCPEDIRVGFVETDVGYLLKLEERHQVRRRRQARDVGADVDADEWLVGLASNCKNQKRPI